MTTTKSKCSRCKLFGFCMGEILNNKVGWFPFVACLSCGRLILIPDSYASIAPARPAKYTVSDVCKAFAWRAQQKTEYLQKRHDQPETGNLYGTTACICDRPSCQAKVGAITRKVAEEYNREREIRRIDRGHNHIGREKAPMFEFPLYSYSIKTE